MKKLASSLMVTLAIVGLFTSSTLAAPSKKKSAAKVPTSLPAYKGKTKVTVEFQSANDQNGVVLVAEPVAKENSDARKLREESKVVKATPTPSLEKTDTVRVETTSKITVTSPKSDAALALPTKLPKKTVTTSATPPPAEAVVVVDSSNDVRKMETFEVEPAKSTSLSVAIPTVSEKVEAPAQAPTAKIDTVTTVTVDSDATTSATTTPIATTSTTSAKSATDFEDRTGSTTSTSEATLTTTTTVSISRSKGRTVFFEAGYLDSRYDKLQSDLKNGASTMSITLGLPMNDVEVRAALDVAHGMDQSVTPQNTRMLAARGGALARIGHVGRMTLSAGGTIGIAGIDVRSYRGVTASAFTVQQHAMGTALILVPEIGSRVELGQQVLLQVALRYLVLSGQEDLRKLGGLSAAAGVGYDF